jgi:hypothetical protein
MDAMEVLRRVSDQKKHSMLMLLIRPAPSATARLRGGITKRAGAANAIAAAINTSVMAKRATSIVVGSTPCRMSVVASGEEMLKANVEHSIMAQPNTREGMGAACCEISSVFAGICLGWFLRNLCSRADCSMLTLASQLRRGAAAYASNRLGLQPFRPGWRIIFTCKFSAQLSVLRRKFHEFRRARQPQRLGRLLECTHHLE